MHLHRSIKNPILVPDKGISWEGGGVFNCAVVRNGDLFRMLYRAVPGNIRRFKTPWGGTGYTNYISSIGYAESGDGTAFKKRMTPFIAPDASYDRYGCEDPRVSNVGDVFYITYTAIDKPVYGRVRAMPQIALASTTDFLTVKKHGIIGPSVTSKAAAIFPTKIKRKIAMLFTAQSDSPLSSIAIAYFEDVAHLCNPSKSYWSNVLATYGKHIVFPAPRGCRRGPEVGAPPIKLSQGWLFVYCGADFRRNGKKEWSVSAALLDLQDPQKIIARSRGPILRPEKPYEMRGLVPNVTFPESAVVKGDTLYVYYGGGDRTCCLATCKLKALLASLR